MDDSLAEWSTSSNDSIQISLMAPSDGGPKTLYSFRPKFTSSIFGEDESIIGYQDLNINLRYNSCDMRPGLQISYSKKMKANVDEGPTDLKEIFENHLPRGVFEKSTVFDAAIQDPSLHSWRPPGELWKTYQVGDHTYEVWRGNLTDLIVQQMVKRIQILVSFFIDGGTPIELKEPEWSLKRWTVFFLYRKQTSETVFSPYIFMGYSTVYQYFFVESTRIAPVAKKFDFTLPLPELRFSTLPCRSRISQFIILPPFQGGGNGSRFYNAMFEFYLQDSKTVEITVEDPNEAFDDLRDLNDLTRLRSNTEFINLRINTAFISSKKERVPGNIINTLELEKIRKSFKIAPRQFSRLVEMELMSKITGKIRNNALSQTFQKNSTCKDSNYDYRLWRLLVKARLFHHNRDALIQLDYLDRIEKLDETLWNVERDYERLIRAFESRSCKNADESTTNSSIGKRPHQIEMRDLDEHTAKKAKNG